MYVSTEKYYILGSAQQMEDMTVLSLDLLVVVATGNSCQMPLKNMCLKKTHSCITLNSTKYSNMPETISNK